ncbi:unnamed protein product (macronuclear) [Paramecium tetraurelia]|uniref:Cache domain-containing protein n=1 Tax=Paramecium tetraurelia TaxID=5888 RepID=A0DZZ7_PARTE|nr:uncharacterized protein GSPATT00021782001 [Paramecium tetraurelia]CAK88614.1 unnamed protein product [Paramecium tetraurelia]|eukprot:XP_001456011.1 hypothetical protein (macronuclear) [Paramecium tetraurelia strain d4-2]
MKDAFLSDSMNVLIKETNIQLTSQSALYDQRLKTIINQIFRKQRMFQNIYLFVDVNEQIIQTQTPFYCPPNISQAESKSFFCLMAYQYDLTNYTNLQTEIKKQFQVISIFHETLPMFDQSQFIATGIAYTTNDQVPILGTWPALNSTLSYNAHQRSWYLSHLKQMGNGKQYLFSDLFTTILGSYTIAISQNITNKHNNFEGVVFNLMDFGVFKKNFNADYILANNKGQIIIGQFNYPENTTKPVFFFNDSITGFNQIDWESISTLIDGKSNKVDFKSLNNCSLDVSNYLCRYNSLYRQEVLLIAKQLEYPPYPPHIVIIFKNITELYQQVDLLNQDIYELFAWEIQRNMQILALLAIGIILLFLIILNYITKSLGLLIKYSKFQQNNLQYLKAHQEMNQQIEAITNLYNFKQNQQLYKLSENALDQLNMQYFQLLSKLKGQQGEVKKSEECLQMEQTQYPMTTQYLKFQKTYYLHDYQANIEDNTVNQLIYYFLIKKQK